MKCSLQSSCFLKRNTIFKISQLQKKPFFFLPRYFFFFRDELKKEKRRKWGGRAGEKKTSPSLSRGGRKRGGKKEKKNKEEKKEKKKGTNPRFTNGTKFYTPRIQENLVPHLAGGRRGPLYTQFVGREGAGCSGRGGEGTRGVLSL